MAVPSDLLCRIEVLGTLRVLCSGKTLTHFPRQKAARLLTYLALHPRQAHPRERLIDLFWPDLDLPAGRDSLSTTLTALRRLLGLPNALLATHQTVSLNWEILSTDAAEFESLVSAANREPDPRTQAERLMQAADLYRGEACAGIYDDWAVREGERLHGVYTGVLRGLTQAFEHLDETEDARRAAARWVAADSYCEEAHMRLIALHLRAGHPGEAHTAAKKLAHLWQEEFGAPLSPVVQAELASILASETAPASPASIPLPSIPLPVPLDLFFGRETERAWLAEWLIDKKSRLVTLIGPGGMGKTRLALDFAAQASACSSHFVPLSETEDAAQILSAIARALGLPPGSDPAGQLAAFFEPQTRPLLILDNLEQLIAGQEGEAARIIQSLLLASPKLSCLCTSRLPLSLRGERRLPVPPLPLPPEAGAGTEISACASVQLYLDRARAVRPDFSLTPENMAAVAAICRLLDGSPLALELAASWVRLLPPRAMWERLTRRSGATDLETRRFDAPARHHSLRAALDWSWRLLKPAEQHLFQQVSVFRGGWTLSAAEAVCREPDALTLLSGLLEASLVRVTEEKNGEARYSLLETVRQYARERLEECGEWEETRGSHAAHFHGLVSQAELTGPNQAHWYTAIEADYDNIGAALDRLAQAPDSAQAGLEMAGGMQQFWQVRGLLAEGRARIETALVHPDAQGQTAARAAALHGAANLASRQADLPAAAALHQECLTIHRACGNELGTAKALMGLGIVAITAGDLDDAQCFYEETLMLYRRLDAPSGLGDVLNDLGNLAVHRGRPADARPFYEEALQVRRRRGDGQSVANTLSNLGPLLIILGDFDGAATAISECLRVCLELGNKRDAVFGIKAAAELASAQGNAERAACLLSAEAAQRESLGMPRMHFRECLYQEHLDTLRQLLSPACFSRAWTKGQRFTWDEAVAYALTDAPV